MVKSQYCNSQGQGANYAEIRPVRPVAQTECVSQIMSSAARAT